LPESLASAPKASKKLPNTIEDIEEDETQDDQSKVSKKIIRKGKNPVVLEWGSEDEKRPSKNHSP
jgi:hypothetical protein